MDIKGVQENTPKYGKRAAIQAWVRRMDNAYSRGVIQRLVGNQFGILNLRQIASRRDHKIVIRYRKDITSLLSSLCDKYGSDKGSADLSVGPYHWPSHTYADYYSVLFAHARDSICNVFECGIGNSKMGEQYKPGASLRVWRDYFPHAKVVGADIVEENLFTDDRINTYYVDQTDPGSVRKLWDLVDVESFDLMIDDGLHTYEAGICFFENSIQKLSEEGIYVIEDVMPENLVKFGNYFADKRYKVELVSLSTPTALKVDNNLVVIRKLNDS